MIDGDESRAAVPGLAPQEGANLGHLDCAEGCVLFRAGLFGFAYGVEEAKEFFDPGHFQRGMNAAADTDQCEETSFFIVGHVGADQSTDAGGVYVRDLGEIDDQRAGVLGPNGGLKLKESSEHYRTLQTENALAGLGTVEFVDCKRLLRL